MESLSFYIGVIGNIISVLVFLAPIGTFKRIIEHRSTEEFESLPYICTLLGSSLWIYYGLTKPGEYLVATVNIFGAVAESVYIILFLVYASSSRMRIKTATLVGILNVGFLGAVIVVTRLAFKGETRIDAIGFISAGLNIVMYGSPLAAMKTVIMTKSVEYMPFFLSFFLFLNGGVWAWYAILMDDYFVGVPNGAGFILGTAQLVLYAIYRNAKPSINNVHSLEKGSQHEHLIPTNQE